MTEDKEKNMGKAIPRDTVEMVLSEFEEKMRDEINKIDARIRFEKHTAPESYIDDLNGFSRGMSVTRDRALKFFREKLLHYK